MRLELTPWEAPPIRPLLEAGHVHLWRFRLDSPTAEIQQLKQLLSDDELSRAERLLEPIKSQRFMVARACLRQILSRYHDQPAASLQFRYGPAGKPQLTTTPQPFFFNLSHAGSWGLLAITGDGEVGVDIELVDPEIDYANIARQFLPPTDLTQLMKTPLKRRPRVFYRLWTAREAVLKAGGSGFSSHSTTESLSYYPRNFSLTRNYLCALAINPESLYIDRWNWPHSFSK